MGLYHSPSVVMNGLVLCLDAGNTKSYDKYENLYTYSETFAGIWNTDNVTTVTSNQGTAPDNSNTATKLVGPYIYRYFTSSGSPIPSGTTVTVSVFAKNNGANSFDLAIRCISGSIFISTINLSTGTVTSGNAQIQAYPNGWYRVSLTATINTANAYCGIESIQGSGTSQSIFVWGAQVERSSAVNDYYATVASTKSRGTTWTDLSGNGNTGTMYGSVPFSTDVAPCFDFATATGGNAASSSLGFTFASNMIPITGNFTFSCWIKNPNTTVGQTGLFSNAGGADGYRFGVGTNGIYFLIGPTYTEGNIGFTSSLSSSLWYNVVAVYSRTTASVLLYLNGVFQSSASIPASQTAMTNAVPGLVRSACCGIYTGKLAGFSAYNRGLTASEITQNFNALRGRYGI